MNNIHPALQGGTAQLNDVLRAHKQYQRQSEAIFEGGLHLPGAADSNGVGC